MLFELECPACKHVYQVGHASLADPAALKCRLCEAAPAPDIMTAYQNVGKTMTELYGCCECGEGKGWLPKAVKC